MFMIWGKCSYRYRVKPSNSPAVCFLLSSTLSSLKASLRTWPFSRGPRTTIKIFKSSVSSKSIKVFILHYWFKKTIAHPGYPQSHRPSFSHLTEKKVCFQMSSPLLLSKRKSWKEINQRLKDSYRILPDSENTYRGNKPSDCSSLSERKQRDRTLSGQSRTWPVWVHPGLVHLPVFWTIKEKLILIIFKIRENNLILNHRVIPKIFQKYIKYTKNVQQVAVC